MEKQMLHKPRVPFINILELLADLTQLVHFPLAPFKKQLSNFIPYFKMFRLCMHVRENFCPQLWTQSRCVLLLDTVHSANVLGRHSQHCSQRHYGTMRVASITLAYFKKKKTTAVP